MPRRAQQLTLADVVVLGVAPLLLIGLASSLTFFLLEVLYRGDYPERLRYIFGCFIVAAVLISRIAMTMGRPRALAYAAALGGATFLALGRFVEIPPNNPLGTLGGFLPYLFVLLIWWCVDLLTHDCTHTGHDDEAGLLDLGLMNKLKTPAAPPDEGDDDGDRKKAKTATWLEQYTADRQEEQRRHRPGTWLVVFSLAALPLFALGQAMIPAADEERRRYVYWLLTLYVACGLGLLLTTSFLGLRRYLRQRNLEMPANLTTAWLGVGGALIVALLILATFLPRPAAEYSVPGLLGFAKSKKRDADRFAFHNFEGGQKRGQGGGKGETPGDQKQQGGGPTERDPNAKQAADGQRGQGGKGGSGQPQSGGNRQNSQQQGQGQGGKQNGKNDDKQQSQDPNEAKNQGKDPGDANAKDPNQQQPQGSAPNKDGQANPAKTGDREQNQDQQKGSADADAQNQDRSSMQPPEFEPQPPSALANLLKWLFILALLAGIAYAVIRYHKELLDWLRSLLAGWGMASAERKAGESGPARAEEEEWRPPPPFSTFRDPFEQPGRFKTNEEIVRYSYAALESWAYEQNLGRKKDETPLEFIRKLTAARPKLDEPGKKLVDLYSQIIYAKGRAGKGQMEAVRLFWQTLPEAGLRARPAEAAGV